MGWGCCACTFCCCAPSILLTDWWCLYFYPFAAAISSIDTARWIAFTAPLRRGPAAPPPPAALPNFVWVALPQIATAYYDAEVAAVVELAAVAPAPPAPVTVQPLPVAETVPAEPADAGALAALKVVAS